MSNFFERVLENDTADKTNSMQYKKSQTNWQPELNIEDLKEVFQNGASVNIFLRPSDKIAHRSGSETYIENYSLPNHILEEDRYISFTDGHHNGINDNMKGPNAGFKSYYCYSNVGPGFFNVTTLPVDGITQSNIQIMNKVRYEEMEWVVRNDYEEVFSGTNFENNHDVIEAIKAARNFRIALTTSDNIQFRFEVDLLFYYPDSKKCFGYTKCHFLPTTFLTPCAFHTYSLKNFLNENGKFPPELSISTMSNTFSTLYYFHDDGTFQTIDSEKLSKKQEYKYIRIFASKN
ncbi:hypothetical protein [Curvivirga aplysinae]|uniref:hypothetical protein n=1 Tax=Curvivirga aplysinae TaxID=2529852 RepID=UPI0012BD8220|nr:hypothetical protein [Curvivirga aplysinae]MTI08334.1 hypothetical protein [Curvivirga aplysinae]